MPAAARPTFRPLALALLCLALLAACAPERIVPPPAPAAETWEAFALRCAGAAPAFSLRGSLNYAGPGRQSRVVLKFWGNVGYPLRLDMTTGFGSPVAYWREDDAGFLTFAPGEQAAWRHRDAVQGTAALGLPFPFSLRDLALLATGNVRALLPEMFVRAEPTPDGGWNYVFSRKEAMRRLTLDREARPAALEGLANGRAFTLRFADFGQAGLGPDQAATLHVDLAPDVSAVLRIKAMDIAAAAWPAASLALPLPPGTALRDLSPGQGPEPLDLSRN